MLTPSWSCAARRLQVGADGKEIMLEPPTGDELPKQGYDAGEETYQAPAGAAANVVVDPNSKRLQLLTPFDKWNGKDLEVIHMRREAAADAGRAGRWAGRALLGWPA